MADIRDVIKDIVPKQDKLKWGKPISSYKLTFDSQQAKLEPIYYWILDLVPISILFLGFDFDFDGKTSVVILGHPEKG